MQAQKKQISVVMPALNEEHNIKAAIDTVISSFREYNLAGEIVVINDGSTDNTVNFIKEEISLGKGYNIKLINHDKPHGVGASFWDGVDLSEGDIVVMLPGDNENDPREIFRYYKLLEHVDIVIPFVFNKEVRSIFRNTLSFVYRFIINSTFFVNFNYTNGTILYRRSILKDLDYRSSGFFFQTDILIRLVRKGYLFSEVPYKLSVRKGEASKAVSFPSLLQVIKGYLRLVKDNCKGRGRQSENFTGDSQTAVRRDL
jgi:glycosyltransferase involved in cell wall biosynthesis